MIGADKIPALSGASYTNQPEEDDDPDRPTLFKFGQQYQVTGRSLLLFVLRQARPHRRRPSEKPAPAKAAET